jgi:hypothetical protein
MCGVVNSARERMAPGGGAFLGTFTAPTPPRRRRSKNASGCFLVPPIVSSGRRVVHYGRWKKEGLISLRSQRTVGMWGGSQWTSADGSPPERSGFRPVSNGPGKRGGPRLPSGSQWRNCRRVYPAGTGPESRFQQTVKRSFLDKHQAQASHPADLGPRIRSPTQWEDRRCDELSVVTR